MDDLKSVKAFLKTAFDAQKRLDADKALLGALRDRAEGANGVQYDKLPVSGGKDDGPALERSALAIVDLEQELERDKAKWVEAVERVRRVVNTVEDSRLREILERRYIRGQKWETIAVDTGYSWQHTHKLHGRALKVVKEKIECDPLIAV